jgi:purine-binding chemotaxis protein CheW
MIESTVDMEHCVVFTLDELFYGIRLSVAVRMLRAVEITPPPNAPSIVMGIIDLGGRIIPVVNIRRRCQLLERQLELSDQLIVAMRSGVARAKTRAGFSHWLWIQW